ncbi:MAG: META domain-containing protein [Anaerolineales bacterium]
MTEIARRYRWMLLGAIVAAAGIAVGVRLVRGPAGDLAGTRWALVSLYGQPPIPGSGPITLEFESGGRAGGDSGCNSYGATYVARRSALSITDVVSTLRACVDPRLNDQEAAYLGAPAVVASYGMEGDRLILRDAGGADVLVLTRA